MLERDRCPNIELGGPERDSEQPGFEGVGPGPGDRLVQGAGKAGVPDSVDDAPIGSDSEGALPSESRPHDRRPARAEPD